MASEYSPAVDEAIEHAAGKEASSAGCGLWEGATRDLEWTVSRFDEAVAIKRNIERDLPWPPVTVYVKER